MREEGNQLEGPCHQKLQKRTLTLTTGTEKFMSGGSVDGRALYMYIFDLDSEKTPIYGPYNAHFWGREVFPLDPNSQTVL